MSNNKVKINYKKISLSSKLTDNMIREYSNHLDWSLIGINQKLSDEIIEEFEKVLNWDNISKYQELSEEFIEKYLDRVNWYLISKYQKLSIEFINKYVDRLEMSKLCKHQLLSEDFMDKYNNRLNWKLVSRYQVLSEDFIRKYENKVSWKRIYTYQKLSEPFINEMINKHYKNGYYEILLKNQNLSLDFIKANIKLFNYNSIVIICTLPILDDGLIDEILSTVKEGVVKMNILHIIMSHHKIKPELLYREYKNIDLNIFTDINELEELLNDELFNDPKILKDMILKLVNNNLLEEKIYKKSINI